MFNERPPTRKVIPAWDLNTVLEFLKGPPFEPLGQATLKYITLKTVFLVAVASARRCSELYAFSEKSTIINRAGVTLCFRPVFVAKNESSSYSHSTLFLPRIESCSSVSDDRIWCPVRALRYYLAKTSSLRGNNDHLFLTHAEPHGPASKQTIARWIAGLIVDSKAMIDDERPHAHQVRAISASWAFKRGMSVNDICEAVSWRAPTTFTTAYFRNVEGNSLRGSFARHVLRN